MPASIEAEGALLRCVIPPTSRRSLDRPWFIGSDPAAGSVRVGALVGRVVVGALAATPCSAVRELLDRHALHAALVLDDSQKVAGTVLRADLTERFGVVADVMTAHAPCVRESAPLSLAIEPMAHGKSRVVAVLRDDGHFVGLLTELDVLRWIARGGGD